MKTRINKEQKAALYADISHSPIIYPVKEQVELQQAYDSVLAILAPLLRDKYPVEDMRVLEKYELTNKKNAVCLAYHDAKDRSCNTVFYLPNTDTTNMIMDYVTPPENITIMLPSAGNPYAHLHYPILQNAPLTAAVIKWQQVQDNFHVRQRELRAAYIALVKTTQYKEDLIMAWPESEEIMKKSKGVEVSDAVEAMSIVQQNLCERGVKKC